MTSDVSSVSEKNNNKSNEIVKLENKDDDIEILSVEEIEPVSVEELEGTFVILSLVDLNDNQNWYCFFFFLGIFS